MARKTSILNFPDSVKKCLFIKKINTNTLENLQTRTGFVVNFKIKQKYTIHDLQTLESKNFIWKQLFLNIYVYNPTHKNLT